MIYAMKGGSRVEATPGARATCPACAGDVVAKCGEIVKWHWAHTSIEDCDPWAEGETPWHRGWKDQFPADCREVVVGSHRADVRLPGGFVLEFQHSAITPAEIREREAFYGPAMCWVFDAVDAANERRLDVSLDMGTLNRRCSFKWRHFRKSILETSRKTCLDIGDGRLLELREVKVQAGAPLEGWGHLWSVAHAMEHWRRIDEAKGRAASILSAMEAPRG